MMLARRDISRDRRTSRRWETCSKDQTHTHTDSTATDAILSLKEVP
jgi:hypothetical protein